MSCESGEHTKQLSILFPLAMTRSPLQDDSGAENALELVSCCEFIVRTLACPFTRKACQYRHSVVMIYPASLVWNGRNVLPCHHCNWPQHFIQLGLGQRRLMVDHHACGCQFNYSGKASRVPVSHGTTSYTPLSLGTGTMGFQIRIWDIRDHQVCQHEVVSVRRSLH